jgi:hypothetical protein
MNTPMETKLKLLVDSSSELVDVTLYRQIIGSLIYLMNTRPYICFVVNTMSQYLVDPRRVHLVAAKYVMRYLKGTLDFGIFYNRDQVFCNILGHSGQAMLLHRTLSFSLWNIM